VNESTRVLVVDEEEGMTHVLGLALGFEGWTVSTVGLGETVAQAVDDFDPHVIVLDITLPDISGVDVARSLRERGISTPIIFLTGRDTIDDRLAAYAAGGDDYLTKPFGLEEVIDRLRAILRRTGQLSTSIVAGDLVLDTETREAWRAGEALLPTRAEFDALLDETSQYAA
jgi:DNA-binding response OmpR family regulator